MRLRNENCQWMLLTLINMIGHGHAVEKSEDFRKSVSAPNSLMDTTRKKYSYPKEEVTAGVGYGHHLHPFYYQGEKEIMYPCAVECGEWEAMDVRDSTNDASSNVDVVTVHPDLSEVTISSVKSRPYKDTSELRPKKYHSITFTSTTPKPSVAYADLKGANQHTVPRKSKSRYSDPSNSEVVPNDGSLYARLQKELPNGYASESSDISETMNNEYFNPVEESMSYNSPSFADDDSDDMDAPVFPTNNQRPNRGRLEEKYVRHNIRDEIVEDLRTNAFDESTGNSYNPVRHNGRYANKYDPLKYLDDYAAPKPYLPQPSNQNGRGEFYNNRHPIPESNVRRPFKPSQPQGQIPDRQSYGKVMMVRTRPANYGRQRKYQSMNVGRPHSSASVPVIPGKQYSNYRVRPYTRNYNRPNQFYNSEGHVDSPAGRQIANRPGRIHPLETFQRPYIVHQENRSPHGKTLIAYGGNDQDRKVIFHREIPRKDGFTRIVKRYRTFANRTPNRFPGSGA